MAHIILFNAFRCDIKYKRMEIKFQIIIIFNFLSMKNITKNLQFILLTIILISTVIAVGIEIKNVFKSDSYFS